MTILHAASIIYLLACLWVIWDMLHLRNDQGEPRSSGIHTFVWMWLPIPIAVYALTL